MKAPLWTSETAAMATGGQARGKWSVFGLSIDTRSLKAGDLFVPIKDVRDGHEFIQNARSAGAGAVISERVEEEAPVLIVEDSLTAMRDLAVAARHRSAAKRIAITGSVGKTSLKEAISVICETSGATHKSLKSFNNHWGVPLTLASMPESTDFGVFEVGMNHVGELADLSPLIAPDVAIITKIAPAHLAHFKNVDAIASAKAEIFEGLKVGGIVVLNRDDKYFDFLSAKASERAAKIITFGEHMDSHIRISNIETCLGGSKARLYINGQLYSLRLNLEGVHWVYNAACSVAATWAVGISVDKALEALESFQALPGRGEIFSAELDDKIFTVIDDSYNANPESMRAAIAALGLRGSGRKIAILGDMFELGKDELRLHAELSKDLVKADVSRIIFVGECMRALRGALPREMRGNWTQNWEDAFTALQRELQNEDTVLIKGSNATGLGRLVAFLKESKRT